ncbi:hypothetical protein [Amycolatopsis nigrescens]|uniref:hypothetical protein n=1 Tax=Amycolatopsis nigrescens TaxID=381445 RepID=UPI000362E816|nr:hypothetical protein [Amycolatopsis nigrescens]
MDDQRAMNAKMIEQIRQDPVLPAEEGRPAVRVASVPGRRSGLPRPFPVAVTRFDGLLHLCSHSRRADWVRNLLAAGRCVLERDGEYRVELLGDDEAAVVVARYLPVAGFEPADLAFTIGAAAAEIRPHVTRFAVFRLHPDARSRQASSWSRLR